MTDKHMPTSAINATTGTRSGTGGMAGFVGAPGHRITCTCQDCRDAAEDADALALADLYAEHAVETTGDPMPVVCGGCEQPIEALRDGDRIITQQPCGCRWNETRKGG